MRKYKITSYRVANQPQHRQIQLTNKRKYVDGPLIVAVALVRIPLAVSASVQVRCNDVLLGLHVLDQTRCRLD